MSAPFANTYADLPVLVTGHTGFKGSWLVTWLLDLGARVIGYSLEEPPTTPSNFQLSDLACRVEDVRGDVRDLHHLQQTGAEHRPRLIFHLAAQPIVYHAFARPKETLDVNAGGTVNVLEAIRNNTSVQALVTVTTDKVYENREWLWGYRETDRLGGNDPYGASKAMAELALSSYRHTYFPPERFQEHGVAIATARAGNVVGGGDFADYRLVPDCMRALMAGEAIEIRSPHSIRPWQHVLEPLSGYLQLGARLLQEGQKYAEAWNFGPNERKGVSVRDVADKLIELWGSGRWTGVNSELAAAETGLLRLSWEKAATCLDWRPVYTWEEALAELVAWFKAFQREEDMYRVGQEHIRAYMRRAREIGVGWATA